MPIEYWFPTPIYFNLLDEIEIKELQEEINSAILSYQSQDLSNPWGDTVKTSFKYNTDVNFLSYTPKLKEKIDKSCRDFLNSISIKKKYNIIESWFNISNKNDYQHFHIHDNFDFSGVYYHKTNGNDGNIVFNNPSLAARSHQLTSKIGSQAYFTPKEGGIIIFPSFLEHAVYQNTTDNERISIAFNARLKENK